MKTLVVYSSQTGNTLKLAEAVFEAISGEKEILSVDNAPDPSEYDLIAVGFWFKKGKPDPKSAEYLGKVAGESLFLFATHGAAAGSEHAIEGMDFAKSLAPESDILGTFSCQGEVNPKILEKAAQKPQPPVWFADAQDAVGHPNSVDTEILKQQVTELFID